MTCTIIMSQTCPARQVGSRSNMQQEMTNRMRHKRSKERGRYSYGHRPNGRPYNSGRSNYNNYNSYQDRKYKPEVKSFYNSSFKSTGNGQTDTSNRSSESYDSQKTNNPVENRTNASFTEQSRPYNRGYDNRRNFSRSRGDNFRGRSKGKPDSSDKSRIGMPSIHNGIHTSL